MLSIPTPPATPEPWGALAVFAAVASITPGPNNLMLLASGVNFGFRATRRHIAGISAGFAVLLAAVGLGLAAAFQRWPLLHTVLQVGGAAYLLVMAWGLARAGALAPSRERPAAPLGFWPAAAFQWVNPKAWLMAITAFSTFSQPGAQPGTVGAMVAVFVAVNLPCVASWAWVGARLRAWMAQGHRQRRFNQAMAALLVLSLWPLWR